MKRARFIQVSVLLALAVVLGLSGCASFMAGTTVSKPDGENDTMIYGYLDTKTEFMGVYVSLQFLPWECEIKKEDRAFKKMFTKSSVKIEPKIDKDLLNKCGAPIIKNVFMVENFPPGDYYLASMTLQSNAGDIRIIRSYIMDRPERKDAIHLKRGEMYYWGARNLVRRKGKEPGFEVSDTVTRKDVTETVAALLKNKGWAERLLEEN